jgi:branched-chain amino acid transport system permease protein
VSELLPLAISLDFLSATSFWINVLTLAGIYGIFTLGLQLNVGYTGVVNFGQAGFMAVGAYASVILVVDVGVNFYLALPLAILITMLVSLLIGVSSLRLRTDYFAIATIAFAEIIRYVAQNARNLTGGNQGTISIELDNDRFFVDTWYIDGPDTWILENILDPIGLGGSDYEGLPLLLTVWVTLLALTFGLRALIGTPWGRVLRAVREDEDAARALGKNAFSYKLQSLAIAAGLGALSGWFLAISLESVSQESFEPLYTFIGYAILVLGGLASFPGVMVGSVIMWTLLEGMRFADLPLEDDKIAALRFIFVGLILILLMAFRPQGVFGKKEEMVLGD